jgi:transcriptional regulator with XRE-family HTH domain
VVNRADDLDPNASLSHLMAYYLRFYRERHQMTQSELAPLLHTTNGHLSNLERARRRISIDQATDADRVFDLPAWFEHLHHHAQGEHRDWLVQYSAMEQEADELRIWQPLWVPGLFQTVEYASAALQSGRTDDIETKLATRMERQRILDTETPPEIWVLLHEASLLQDVGGPAVMRAQIDHLLRVSERQSVSIQIVPMGAGAHAGLDGGFNLITTDEGQAAFVDAPLGGRLVQDEQESRSLHRRYDHIRSFALSAWETREKLSDLMEGTA